VRRTNSSVFDGIGATVAVCIIVIPLVTVWTLDVQTR
jgi:hypothetical protein